MSRVNHESWRSVPGYEMTYLVSSHGRVKSIPRPRTRGGLLAIKVGKRGYPAVALVQDGKQTTQEVHRLVAWAFIGPALDGMEVRHIDGNPLNPHRANLIYGTKSENVRDKRGHGTDHNVNKTHCPQGHPYEGDNILRIPSRPDARYCRTCNVARKADHPDYLPEWAR
jgi:hypothetical protein